MSKDDPIGIKGATRIAKDVWDTTVKAGTDTIREAGRVTGIKDLEGIGKGIQQYSDLASSYAIEPVTSDLRNKKAKYEEAKNEAERKAGIVRAEAVKKAKAEAFNTSEKERMAVGSGARTLLTGPAGLEDSEDDNGYSLSRKTLKGV